MPNLAMAASRPVHFLQSWMCPNVKSAEPRYQQARISDADKRGKWRLIVSSHGWDGSLQIRQDGRLYAALFDGDVSERCVLPAQRDAYWHVANVTPSAVSHGIVGLDKALGVELFTREPRALVLMAAGTDCLSYISEAVLLIVLGTQRLTHSRGSHAIAISGAPTLASRWLLPRLPRLRQQRWAATVVAGFVAAMLHFPIDDATVDVPPRVVGAARA